MAAPFAVDFNHAPGLVIWEVTQACDLACKHCRADSRPDREAAELTTAEGIALLDHIRAEFGEILFVFTGGDPLKRADIYDLAGHAAKIGLKIAVTPSGTQLLTTDAIDRLKAVGVKRMAMSIDGADEATHDGFRQVPGTWKRTVESIQYAVAQGFEIQINSSIGRHNHQQLHQIAGLLGWLGIHQWSVFLLVPTGRADKDQLLTPVEHEVVYRTLADISDAPTTAFRVKTTAGQPFYRVLTQRKVDSKFQARGVNDGNGFLFIGRTGELHPSGFLPLPAGNVREQRAADVYRTHPTFLRLRNPSSYSGKCGYCPHNRICGGSRSRTYALTGDPFSSDPTCVFQPPVPKAG